MDSQIIYMEKHLEQHPLLPKKQLKLLQMNTFGTLQVVLMEGYFSSFDGVVGVHQTKKEDIMMMYLWNMTEDCVYGEPLKHIPQSQPHKHSPCIQERKQ